MQERGCRELRERVVTIRCAGGAQSSGQGHSPEARTQGWVCTHVASRSAAQLGRAAATDALQRRGTHAGSRSSLFLPTLPAHVLPRAPGDLSDVLRLDVKTPVTPGGAPQYLAFKDFESGSALDSALALVEHLMDGG